MSKELNYDLKKINKWTFHWEMSFNLDPNKQALDVIFLGNLLNQINHH